MGHLYLMRPCITAVIYTRVWVYAGAGLISPYNVGGKKGGGAECDRGISMTSVALRAADTTAIIAIIWALVAVNLTKFMINISAMLKLNVSVGLVSCMQTETEHICNILVL
jgi:hypothetical protein